MGEGGGGGYIDCIRIEYETFTFTNIDFKDYNNDSKWFLTSFIYIDVLEHCSILQEKRKGATFLQILVCEPEYTDHLYYEGHAQDFCPHLFAKYYCMKVVNFCLQNCA
jgi:hypothetical protein